MIRVRGLGEGIGYYRIGGDMQLHAFRFRFCDDAARGFEQVLFNQRCAGLSAHGLHEGVGHAAADDQLVAFANEVLQHFDLAAHLAAAHDGGHGALRIAEHLAHAVDLGLHQIAEELGRREEFGYDGGAGMRAVRRAESVVHVHIAEFAEALAETLIAALLFRMEAQVLQHQHFPGLQGCGFRLRVGSDAVGCEEHGLAQ